MSCRRNRSLVLPLSDAPFGRLRHTSRRGSLDGRTTFAGASHAGLSGDKPSGPTGATSRRWLAWASESSPIFARPAGCAPMCSAIARRDGDQRMEQAPRPASNATATCAGHIGDMRSSRLHPVAGLDEHPKQGTAVPRRESGSILLENSLSYAVVATLRNQMRFWFTPSIGPRTPQQPYGRSRAAIDAAAALPMWFRSEGFAEDLHDSHPVHLVSRGRMRRMICAALAPRPALRVADTHLPVDRGRLVVRCLREATSSTATVQWLDNELARGRHRRCRPRRWRCDS